MHIDRLHFIQHRKRYGWKVFLMTRVDVHRKKTRQHDYSACSTYKEMCYGITSEHIQWDLRHGNKRSVLDDTGFTPQEIESKSEVNTLSSIKPSASSQILGFWSHPTSHVLNYSLLVIKLIVTHVRPI